MQGVSGKSSNDPCQPSCIHASPEASHSVPTLAARIHPATVSLCVWAHQTLCAQITILYSLSAYLSCTRRASVPKVPLGKASIPSNIAKCPSNAALMSAEFCQTVSPENVVVRRCSKSRDAISR
jgi:hypothetical protein